MMVLCHHLPGPSIRRTPWFGAIRAGDLLATCVNPGYAMNLTDDAAAIGALVAALPQVRPVVVRAMAGRAHVLQVMRGLCESP
jgi:hypothetical protein